MAMLPEEIYLSGPNEPAGVLFWGKSPVQSKSDQAAVIARVGGYRSPNYAQSYLLAANTLLRPACAPLLWLQRCLDSTSCAPRGSAACHRWFLQVQSRQGKAKWPRARFPVR